MRAWCTSSRAAVPTSPADFPGGRRSAGSRASATAPDVTMETHAQAAALLRKRARAVARAHPELAAALGAQFGPAFHGYATSRPGPAPGCAAADAEEFARYLRGAGQDRSREVRRAARRVANTAGTWPLRARRRRPASQDG